MRLSFSPTLVIAAIALLPLLASAQSGPRFFAARPGSLVEAKKRIAAGDKDLEPAYKKLIKDADKALQETPPSVMEKTKLPPSRDKHDYISLAPYFWPDPSKRDGLPYIRKDGKTNPDSKLPEQNDVPRLSLMAKSVESLALAYYFTGKPEYAAHAAKFIRTWFLDAATHMNPNFKFAQAVLGENDGRAEGILEARHIAIAADALGLLVGSEAWKPADQQALDKWLTTFVHWLMTSPTGREEHNAKNNHGTWADVTTVRIALCLNRPDIAAKLLKAAQRERIGVQIEKDGSQPLELARTASFSYCWFNIEALSELANLGDHAGVNLWAYTGTGTGGRGLRRAVEYMLPYVDVPAKDWPHEQIKEKKEQDYLPLLRMAALAYSSSEMEGIIEKHANWQTQRFQLLFVKQP